MGNFSARVDLWIGDWSTMLHPRGGVRIQKPTTVWNLSFCIDASHWHGGTLGCTYKTAKLSKYFLDRDA